MIHAKYRQIQLNIHTDPIVPPPIPDKLKGAVDLKRLCYLKKKNISLVIYIFRDHIRAHMKGNEMLFEIIGKKFGL